MSTFLRDLPPIASAAKGCEGLNEGSRIYQVIVGTEGLFTNKVRAKTVYSEGGHVVGAPLARGSRK
ncbi:ABC-type arginine transport system ATPase subunit [Bradyrhizobium japonicum]